MKKNIMSYMVILFFVLLALQSCENEGVSDLNEKENEDELSEYYDMESHNMGQDCMTCHKLNGEGESIFIVAGTVYDSTKNSTYPNSTVKLYTGQNATGNLIATIPVDGKGNFFSTRTIDFGNGLYVALSGKSETEHMMSSVNNGSCNSCHGAGVDRIWTK